MKLSKKSKRIILIGLIFLCIVGFYDIQTHAVKMRRISLASDVPMTGSPVRLIQISDLHYKGNRRNLLRAVSKLNLLRPDVVFITGDIVESRKYLEGALNILAGIKSQNGVYAVAGNWEYWSGILPENQEWFRKELSIAGITFLKNAGVKIYVRENRIDIYGLDSWFAGPWPEPGVFNNSDNHSIKICLAHEPVMFDRWTIGYDIMLSGHSHGGQVTLPWLGPLWLPEGCGRYFRGKYSKGGRFLYVNSGIGTSIFGIRLFARPEITLFELH